MSLSDGCVAVRAGGVPVCALRPTTHEHVQLHVHAGSHVGGGSMRGAQVYEPFRVMGGGSSYPRATGAPASTRGAEPSIAEPLVPCHKEGRVGRESRG